MNPSTVSLLKNNTECTLLEIKDAEQLANTITKHNWSPGLYTSNYRNLTNFKEMHVIGLDFDEGLSVEEAAIIFSGYRHVIATTRNHQKEKHGVVSDRFRVILFLTRPIISDEEYKATFHTLRQKWPQADAACSDASRQFFKCSEIVAYDDEGQEIIPSIPSPKEEKKYVRKLSGEEQGRLARSTLEFIALGAPTGTVNARLFKAAKDMQEQGFEEEDAASILLDALERQDPAYDRPKSEGTIVSAFRKEAKYEPRGFVTNLTQDEKSGKEVTGAPNTGILSSIELLPAAIEHILNPEAIKGISTGYKEIDKLLGGLRQSELGIIQAYPKSGKTVFLTNLMANLTAQGIPVGFASLEMHPAKQVEPDLYSILLKKDIRSGITNEDRTKLEGWLQSGRGLYYLQRDSRPTPEQIAEWARRVYNEKGVKHIFIDHLHKFVADETNISHISKAITTLTGLKYEIPELHIVLIVQPTKEQKDKQDITMRVNKNTLRGGAVIFDEADYLINLHTKYRTYKTVEKPWGDVREYHMASYPNDIRELEFEAIRAKPYSENMGAKIHMKYDKHTTEMKPHVFIAPATEHVEMSERSREYSERKQDYNNNNNRPAVPSGWAKKTFGNKRV